MKKSIKMSRQNGLFVMVGLLVFVTVVAWPLAVHAIGKGVTIKITAQNLSTTDTPFCGIGGGLKGDKLTVNVFTDLSGVTTGTATFKDASGNITTLNIDHVFGFATGGIVLMDSSNNNVVAIWLNDDFAPAHVNVELPQGCDNTKSTFTLGVDRVSVQIKF